MNRVTIGYVDSSEHRVRVALAARGRHLSTGESAMLLGLSSSTINRWCATGRITAFREGHSGHWRIPLQNLLEFARARNWVLSWDGLNLE